MASKKDLKKKVKRVVYNILNRCDEVIVNNGKNADKADSIIDEAVDFHDSVIARINAAKSKKEFNEVSNEVNSNQAAFDKKVEAL